MHSLQSKKILLGITGSIAAYKAAHLVRHLTKAGAEVKVIMTRQAIEFITPLTLATLSKHPVVSEFTDHPQTGVWNNHVELALWADAMLIAPASANTIAKCANGLCDNLLMATYLSTRSKVFVAPAMDLDMLQHPATKENLERLQSFGNEIIEPGYGELASGLVGAGRMAEPESIVQRLARHFARRPEAAGKKVLITAGPTQEDLDPVRFISNHSSGKMGYAMADAFAAAGCEVTLVSGPVAIAAPEVKELIKIRSAQEMYEATASRAEASDLIVFAAAVADYAPKVRADQKIKKKESELSLELTKTVDIAATVGARKKEQQLLMGFALETNNEVENAKSKLRRKNFDFVVLNSLNDIGAGFGHDTNQVVVLDKNETIRTFGLRPKSELAEDLLEIILEKWRKS